MAKNMVYPAEFTGRIDHPKRHTIVQQTAGAVAGAIGVLAEELWELAHELDKDGRVRDEESTLRQLQRNNHLNVAGHAKPVLRLEVIEEDDVAIPGHNFRMVSSVSATPASTPASRRKSELEDDEAREEALPAPPVVRRNAFVAEAIVIPDEDTQGNNNIPPVRGDIFPEIAHNDDETVVEDDKPEIAGVNCGCCVWRWVCGHGE